MADLDDLINRAFDDRNSLRILDALIRVLWKKATNERWPELSFSEMTLLASEMMQYPIGQPTVRSLVYRNPELFERVDNESFHPKWRISRALRSKKNL